MDALDRIKRIGERWFLTEPLLFAVFVWIITHRAALCNTGNLSPAGHWQKMSAPPLAGEALDFRESAVPLSRKGRDSNLNSC